MLGPNLSKAIVDVLYDNGVVNYSTTEATELQRSAEVVIKNFSDFEITQAELFLSSLTTEEFEDFVIGSWARCTLTDGETYADRILNEVFDNL